MRSHPRFRKPIACLAALALSGVLATCDEGDGARTAALRSGRWDAASESGDSLYREVEVTAGGTIAGRVLAPEQAPTDRAVRAYNAEQACGESVIIPGAGGARGGLGNAIVWLSGVHAGKPLPIARRFEITNHRCQLEPRVQAAVVGGTLNVRNTDRLAHRTRFLVAGSDSTLDVVRQSDAGQVVPLESILERARRIEVRSEVYPWMQAWIQVFDHPYFTLTTGDGSFALDSIPAGRYQLLTWHEHLGLRSREVVVEAGGREQVAVRY